MMHINKIVGWLFESMPECLFKSLSEPVFSEIDGIVQTNMLKASWMQDAMRSTAEKDE
ncbi:MULTISPECIES: hypothetical protein [Enterobacterales]|uniref:hypothetical protein n=2 Tax=Gammaproteobacteria TaxID=1236 RepID=UPI00052C7FCE|nr:MULTISPECIES: hypothetical protein [Enterobacteriaceae]EDS7250182.1 hypothetical protein [Salmonella enterica subsp. enterica]EEI9342989.1 hypothetical protein [Salmonella enterica subsp. enterica serovar Hvittingfoss]EEK3426661.1 hypothetical protein [Salmonella enterica]EGF1375508.1 hypothetical protein [Salmonella enterica subsp. enterica serovar 4,[5],12:d:-]MDU4215935.1 hypothetical protein [Veillonella sp.]NTX86954.1 hypothetical protein [Citrobacter youngae]HBQ3770791.1 hypothetica